MKYFSNWTQNMHLEEKNFVAVMINTFAKFTFVVVDNVSAL